MKLGNASYHLVNIRSFCNRKINKNLGTFYIPHIKQYNKCSDLSKLKEELNSNHHNRKEIPCSKDETINSRKLQIKKELSNKNLKQVKRNEQILKNFEEFKRNNSYSNLSSEPFRKYIQNKCKNLLEMINNDSKENLINRDIIDNNCNIGEKNWNNKREEESLFHNALKKKYFSLYSISERNKELFSNKIYCIEDKNSFKEKIKSKYFIKSKLFQNKLLNNNNYQNQNHKLRKIISFPNINYSKKLKL